MRLRLHGGQLDLLGRHPQVQPRRHLGHLEVRVGAEQQLGHDRVDVLVQPLVLGHVASVGLVRDPQLGPLVRVGGGAPGPVGSWAEEVLLLPPVEAADAARAVRALRIWPQLVGDHGLEEVDLAPLEALVASVGRLAVDVPHAFEVSQFLLARGILVDYRPGAGIRIAPHFYTTDAELDTAIDAIDEALATDGWRQHAQSRAVVT